MSERAETAMDDPDTAIWRSVPNGPDDRPLRSALAKAYREALDGDWRDYYTGLYTDDGISQHEDCDHCFGTRSEHWEDCDDPLGVGVET